MSTSITNTVLEIPGCNAELLAEHRRPKDIGSNPEGTLMKKFLVLLTFALIAATCSSTTNRANSGDPVNLGPDDVVLTGRLVPFEDCDALLAHVKAEARDRVGPYGLDYQGFQYFGGVDDGFAVEDSAAESSVGGGAPANAAQATADGDSAQGGDFTTTNTQEAGVDEPDIIKNDGSRILVVSENRLRYIDVSGDEPVETDTIELTEGWGHELFFQGDRALLFTNSGSWGEPTPLATTGGADAAFAEEPFPVEPSFGYYRPAATIFEIDLSDPNNLQIDATMRIEGQYLSARSVGTTVRLALTTGPSELPWVYPSSPAGEERAEKANRELIDEMTIEDWIPNYELVNPVGTAQGPLLDCSRLSRPAAFSGFDVVSVLSFDLDAGLNNGDGTGVLAGGQTVYSSTDNFYVATTKWIDSTIANDTDIVEWSEDYETEIHSFSIDVDEPARYVASGKVPGTLLNQFSLDEFEGNLRVITTEGSPWSRDAASETQLIVLAENGDELVQIGRVGGLGKGESLYAARILDDVGFAVTFRQTDPFYVLDLSDPTNPQVTGELKIPGFSTYLHPIDDNRVLGIGQDATDEGRVTGFKLSLFNVADPANPQELATWTMDNANSPAEYDHRAFQMVGNTAIVPVQSWSGDINGAILFDIGELTITEIGQVTHVAESTEPASDCEVISGDRFSQDTELFWAAQEGRVQLCGEGDDGGYGDWYCDPIPVDVLDDYFGSVAASEALEAIETTPTDRIEMCWPDGGNWEFQIQRSLVIGDTLWTMSQGQLQANDLASLTLEAIIDLR